MKMVFGSKLILKKVIIVFEIFDDATGKWEKYTWHHHEDCKTMMPAGIECSFIQRVIIAKKNKKIATPRWQ
jgi:hypothetical protein